MHFPYLVLLGLVLALPACTLAFAEPAPDATLVLRSYGQRMSDRYTSRDGLPGGPVTAVWVAGTQARAQTAAGAFLLEGRKWRAAKAGEAPRNLYPLVETSRLPAGAKLLSSVKTPDGRVWMVTDRGPFRSEGEKYVPVTFPRAYLTGQKAVNIDATFTSVTADRNGTVWFGTDVGVLATDGRDFWHAFDRSTGLPYESVTCLAIGPKAELWVGTTEGVCRYTGGDWQYYWGPRWLPGNRVNDLAVDSEGAAWVATDGGVARLYDRPLTLAQKAEHYEAITSARHNRRGWVTGSRLKTPGDPSGGHLHEASDNDGLWTAVYVAAESFRYAATKDPQARELARKSMNAMLDLVRLSGVPGFPARALIRKGEEVDGYNPEETVRVPGETDKIWYQSPVDPNVLCKGDTSSDELDGHYFAWSVYYDLVADEAEKKEIAGIVAAVTDNLLQHDLTLVGHTGRKTRWGVFAPQYLNDDPTWWEERGLNSLEVLAYLKVAEHICNQGRFTEKYRELIEKHHYLLNTVTQKVAEPWWDVNHSDDQMAFMMYYSLLKLEKDPATRLVLLQSLERSWRIERPEASPFFNFTYGTLTGRPCDTEASVGTLQEWPWELIEWQARGSHRHDLTMLTRSGEGRARSQASRALPAGERRVMRWNGNPYQCDGGTPNGTTEEDGSAWLMPYWMGRYHGLIAEAPAERPR